MQLLYNRRDGDRGSVGAGVVRLLQGAGAIVSRQQRGGWLAGRVGAVVVESRWSRRCRLRRRGRGGGSGDVEVAAAWAGSRQGEGGCGRVEVTSISGGRGGGVSRIAIGWGRVWRCRGGVVSGATAGDRDGLHAREEVRTTWPLS